VATYDIRGERARLRRHFDHTIAALERGGRGWLTHGQRRRRDHILAALFAYRERGRFPKNDWGGARRPVFIDSAETRCAMAHLIDASGHRPLVERVAATRNHAYVRELIGDEALTEWLRAHGMTAREAARVQPTYGPDWNYQGFCSGARGVVLLQASVVDEKSARVISVHGAKDVKVGQLISVDTRIEANPAGQVVLLGAEVFPGATPVWAPTGHVVQDGNVVKGHSVPFDTAIRLLQSPSCAMDMARLYSPEAFSDPPKDGTARPGSTASGSSASAPQPNVQPDGCSCGVAGAEATGADGATVAAHGSWMLAAVVVVALRSAARARRDTPGPACSK